MSTVNENDIREALSMLDPENDEHWTKSGLPALDAVGALAEGVSRAQINAIAPDFTRSNPEIPPVSTSAAARAVADAGPVRVDPTPTPAEPFTPTDAELDAAQETVDDSLDETLDPGPEAAPSVVPETLEQRCARLESERDELREQLNRQAAHVRRLEGELRVNGGSRLDRALKNRPRQQPMVPASGAGVSGD